MARTARDIESYLASLGKRFEQLADGTYVISTGLDATPIALRIIGQMAVFRVLIGDAPRGHRDLQAQVFRRMLELNASELLYCAYGLDQDKMVLSAALELENLDLNEVEAVLADMEMALVRHVPQLRGLATV